MKMAKELVELYLKHGKYDQAKHVYRTCVEEYGCDEKFAGIELARLRL